MRALRPPGPGRLAVLVHLACLASGGGEAAAQTGWLPASWFASGPSIPPGESFPLSEKDGPWLVLASTFRGDGAREDARRLAHELRSVHKLEAFTHEKSFDYSGRPPGLGLNPDGTPKRMRYANASQVIEVAVLVGSFATVDDPRGQKVLARVKSLQPQSISGGGGQSRAFSEFKRSMGLASAGKGPMKLAFMIPNPLLPESFFAQERIDRFVLDMNADVEHGLLECPGRYSVRVAVFTGGSTVDQKRIEAEGDAVQFDGRLVEAAEKARALTLALRRRGHQAWEFHDRDSSIVCVGSFEQLAGQGPDGRAVVNPAIAKIVSEFGPDRQKLAQGVVMPRSIDGIMLEIEPTPIEVPKPARGSKRGG